MLTTQKIMKPLLEGKLTLQQLAQISTYFASGTLLIIHIFQEKMNSYKLNKSFHILDEY